jgi:murein DD-endopeptidase MepM/ murein hydrolase activator NlpD
MTILQRTQLVAEMMKKGHSFISAYNEANGVRAEELYKEYCKPNTVVVSDLFIGNYPVTQTFGKNPALYRRFGWRGHNGIDFGMKTGTQLVSCVSGRVVSAYDDGRGWGKHVYIYDNYQNIVVIYAHLSRIDVKVGQSVRVGKGIGLSGNSGNSTGPHLHFGIYKTNASGYKIDLGNGYGGAIDPFDKKQVTWDVKNPKQPL